MNENITAKQVRLIGKQNEQLGIFTSSEALLLAEREEMDLVMISPNAEPPVCRIMDYGKFCFEQEKKEKELKKNQKKTEVKEIWLSMTIEEHDMQVKAKQASKFIANGDKIKVSIRMRGRQITKKEFGLVVMDKFVEMLGEQAVVEKKANVDGRSIYMFLAPSKQKK